MSLALKLPAAGGALDTYMLSGRESWRATPSPAFNRIAYSAAHVVADVRASNNPWLDCAIDWDGCEAQRPRTDGHVE